MMGPENTCWCTVFHSGCGWGLGWSLYGVNPLNGIANLRVCVTATCMHRLKLPMPAQSTADHGRAKAILCPFLLSLTPPAPNGTGWHCEVSCVHWPWVTGNKWRWRECEESSGAAWGRSVTRPASTKGNNPYAHVNNASYFLYYFCRGGCVHGAIYIY